MQACPYDAIYIDPQTETAAKCNFCAHRVEVGLEPPCVDGVPDSGDRRWRLERPDHEDRAADGSSSGAGPQAREGDQAARLLPRGRRGLPRPVGRASAKRVHVGRCASGGDAARDAADRRCGSATPLLWGEGAASQLVGIPGLSLPLDQIPGRGRLDRAGARFDDAGPAERLDSGALLRAAGARAHRRAARLRPPVSRSASFGP